MFKTELHCHTAEVSNCAPATAAEVAEHYLEAGYTTIVLANHLSKYTYQNKRFDHSGWSWDEKIDYYMDGFHKLEDACGDKIHVLLGCELRLNKDGNDYLMYGVTEEFLRSIPNMMDEKIVDVRAALNGIGGLFFQAHPFRNSMKVTRPEYLDGIEVYNGHIGHDSRNWVARQWAEHFGLLQSSGSDFHAVEHKISGGILTDVPVTSNEQLVELLRSRNANLLKDPTVVPC